VPQTSQFAHVAQRRAAGRQVAQVDNLQLFCDSKHLVLGAICIIEAEAGSDVSAMRSTAKRVDGGFLLNGSK